MAEYLASIFGTEKDKVNCSFYFKIGACRHGDRCSRLHNKPTFSQTILIQNIYRNPQNSAQTADASRCKSKDLPQGFRNPSFSPLLLPICRSRSSRAVRDCVSTVRREPNIIVPFSHFGY
eukprot:XP_014040506.1 PREDICTED: splicing factor U2AF 35 kDa subunit-like [Salmo salar]